MKILLAAVFAFSCGLALALAVYLGFTYGLAGLLMGFDMNFEGPERQAGLGFVQFFVGFPMFFLTLASGSFVFWKFFRKWIH